MDKKEKQALPSKTEEFEDWREPKSKAKIIIVTLLVLIFLEIVGYFSYFYFYLNTSNFLDSVSNYLTNNIDDSMLLKKNLNFDGNIDVANYNLSLNYGENNSASSLKLNLNHEFLGSLFKDNNIIYLNSPRIYDGTLKLSLEDIINDKEDIKYFLTKMVTYHLDALKEGNLTTKVKGLNTKEYIIKLNEEEQKQALKRLKKSVEKDDKLTKMLYKYQIKDYAFLPLGTINVLVDTLKGTIKEFKIDTDKLELDGYAKDDKYLIKYQKEEFTFSLSSDEILLEHKLGNIKIDRKNQKLNGTINIKDEEKEYKFNLNMEVTNNNNFESIDINDSKDIATFNEEELNKILANLENILNDIFGKEGE